MKANIQRFGAAALAVGTMLAFESVAGAQGANPGSNPRLFLVNPNPLIAPGVRLQQYAFNVSVMGRAYSHIPPYMLGYNPYPLAVNYGPNLNPYGFRPQLYNPYSPAIYGNVVPTGTPYAGGYSPYAAGAPANPYSYNPYAGGGGYGGGYSAGGVDPMTGISGGYSAAGGSSAAWNPQAGGYNYSSGQDLLALGAVGIGQEQARILREAANQAKLDTRKKYIDTMAYVRANEYTFSKEQADIADRLVKRVQKTPTPAEIQTGKSLNVLLDDLSKFEILSKSGQSRNSMSTVTLDEDVLKLVNITSPGSYGNIGLLRDGGRFTWPAAFDDKDVASDKERKDIEVQAQELYQQAANAKPNNNTLKDLESALQSVHTKLEGAAKSISPSNYLQAKRFLDSFDAAVVAIKKGDVVTNLEFQQKFNAKGGKTVQELVEYMGSRGLKFAPVNEGDERSYYALQAALAARSMAIHSEVAAAGKDN
jgi:hypothetical protein